MKESILAERSLEFAIRVVKQYQFLCTEKREYNIGKQFLRSGTTIGALIREGQYAESSADFVHKLSIALKECNETIYWLIILRRTGYLTEVAFQSCQEEATQLLKMLTASINTVKAKHNNKQ